MYEDLMEKVVAPENATAAWRAVKRNAGAPGIDGMTIQQMRDHIRAHGETIRYKLVAGTYAPSPVRRVEIPKPNGGRRTLGIPTVLDRWIQQMLLQVLQPIFDPTFSEHSYGFRPGRKAHDAVRAAQGYVRAGQDWVVDMDIAQFFDHVNHDILMTRIGQTIRDKRVLRLIGRYLRAGVMIEGVGIPSEEGTPQGGPLSPLLANLYLHALDQELERRGLCFCRYADDCNVYVGSGEPSGGTGQHGAHRWLGWLQRAERPGVRTRGHPLDACGGRESFAAGPPGSGPAETLVAGNASGSCATRALGLLPRRIHISVQSAHVRLARVAVLPLVGSGGASASGTDAHAEGRRGPHSPIM